MAVDIFSYISIMACVIAIVLFLIEYALIINCGTITKKADLSKSNYYVLNFSFILVLLGTASYTAEIFYDDIGSIGLLLIKGILAISWIVIAGLYLRKYNWDYNSVSDNRYVGKLVYGIHPIGYIDKEPISIGHIDTKEETAYAIYLHGHYELGEKTRYEVYGNLGGAALIRPIRTIHIDKTNKTD